MIGGEADGKTVPLRPPLVSAGTQPCEARVANAPEDPGPSRSPLGSARAFPSRGREQVALSEAPLS